MDFTIEELSMNAWPAIKTILYDGWIIRLSDGYSNRANSINPVYPSKIKLEEKIDYCDKVFACHNLPATYKIAGCGEHGAIEEKLKNLGYQKINETSIQIREIGETNAADDNRGGIIIRDDFPDEWIKSVIEFNRIDETHAPAFRKIVGNIVGEKIVVYKKTGNEISGCGYGIVERGYAGVFDIVVKENHRGKGFGREIIGAILSEAARRGAEKSYLQVMVHNAAALRLYDKLGFREIYRYWYRKKPAGYRDV